MGGEYGESEKEGNASANKILDLSMSVYTKCCTVCIVCPSVRYVHGVITKPRE